MLFYYFMHRVIFINVRVCVYIIYILIIFLASIYTYYYFNNNFIIATICTLCEAPESNIIESGAIQINCIIIIIIII